MFWCGGENGFKRVSSVVTRVILQLVVMLPGEDGRALRHAHTPGDSDSEENPE